MGKDYTLTRKTEYTFELYDNEIFEVKDLEDAFESKGFIDVYKIPHKTLDEDVLIKIDFDAGVWSCDSMIIYYELNDECEWKILEKYEQYEQTIEID